MSSTGVLCFSLMLAFVGLNSAAYSIPDAQHHIANEWQYSCRNETFCTTPSKFYPIAQINKLLKYSAISHQNKIRSKSKFGKRQGQSESDEVKLCDAETIDEPVYEIIDESGKLRFVIQSEKYLMQLVKMEKCIMPDDEVICSGSEFWAGTFSCREARMGYSYMVLSDDGQNIEHASVAKGLPVACYCHMSEIIS